MNRRMASCILALICLLNLMSAAIAEGVELPMPTLLQDETFVYDELDSGTGSLLYTLMFADDGYKLYCEGEGLLASGKVHVYVDRTMKFENGEDAFSGSYQGSAFQQASLEIEWNDGTMPFALASDNSEYVYLSDLGTYEAQRDGEPVILILERWFEYYLYADGNLTRGSYEIYADGTLTLTDTDDSETIGTVTEDGFEIGENSFAIAEPQGEYVAAHAMGEYTLSLYDANVFTIHGVDGLVKALGTVNMDDRTVTYFPRRITGDAELDDRYTIAFEVNDEGLTFPSYTYLLPRSGNIDEDTGLGSYWSAGTVLEFLKKDETASVITTEYAARTEPWTTDDIPLERACSDKDILRQTMPSLGTARPLVLLIDFPDQHRPRFIQAQDIEDALFSLDAEDSLASYYYRASYGNLTIDGTVLDWYRMEKNRGDYDSDTEIMREVLNAQIANGLNLADYDSDGDGEVDALYVLWAGNMDSSSGMWSSAYRSSWSGSPEEWGTKVIGYIFVPGTTIWSSVPPLKCNTNSLTHETGHLLGLNDYYSYDTSDRQDDTIAYTGGALEGGLGGMDMMDVNMGDQNAFSKWLLGWLNPTMVAYEDIAALADEEMTVTLHPSNEQPEAIFVELRPSDSEFTEYLVIEVISPTMNASEFTRLKAPMVRILHVAAQLDDGENGNWRGFGFKFDNSYTSTKFISLLEADGEDTVLDFLPESSKISYDVNDLFASGAVVSPSTYPSTNGYDDAGNATVYNGLTVTVESISESGEAVIRLGYEEESDSLNVTNVTPEPVIVPYDDSGYPVAASGTQTIEVTFDHEIDMDADKIQVVTGNALTDGWKAEADGSVLRITFDEPLEHNRAYTLILKHGAVSSGDLTNANLIYGFIAE